MLPTRSAATPAGTVCWAQARLPWPRRKSRPPKTKPARIWGRPIRSPFAVPARQRPGEEQRAREQVADGHGEERRQVADGDGERDERRAPDDVDRQQGEPDPRRVASSHRSQHAGQPDYQLKSSSRATPSPCLMGGRGAREPRGAPLRAKRMFAAGIPCSEPEETSGLRFGCGAADRHAGAAGAGPADLGHGPLQLPLRLLHAEGGLRPRLRSSSPRASCSRSRRSRASRASSSACGVEKIRLTGGEPLVRRDLETLVGACWRGSTGCDLTLTTNGSLLAAQGRRPLAGRGPAARHGQPRLARRRRLPRHERRRLPGRARARGHRRRARGRPRARSRSNMVVKRGVNEDGILAAWPGTSAAPATSCASSSTWTSARPTAGGWTTSSPPPRSWPRSTPSCRSSRSSRTTAARSRAAGATATASGEIGVISSVTQPFCGDCTRARLSADGKLYTCLFAVAGPRPARPAARRRLATRSSAAALAGIWRARDDRYSELRTAETRATCPRSRCRTSAAEPGLGIQFSSPKPGENRTDTLARLAA